MICFYLPNLEFVSHFAYLMMMGLFVNMKVILFVEERRIFSDWNGGGDSEGLARAEDPGRSIAKEAAEAVPPESVRSNGNQRLFQIEKTVSQSNERPFLCFIISDVRVQQVRLE